MTSGPFKPDNPLVVQWEYASEERLRARNEAYRRLVHGLNAEEVAFDAVAAARPARVLDVGCGLGDFGERVARELGAEVVAVDISPRMVELAAARGLDARLADVQELPFESGAFDCVVANWVLYHVPDVDRGVAELARVLGPCGRLVAATMGPNHMREAWDLVGGEPTSGLSFWSENGAEVLGRAFARVERHDAAGRLVFPDADALREFVAATTTRAHLAANVPDSFDEPLVARSSHVVFVAEKAG